LKGLKKTFKRTTIKINDFPERREGGKNNNFVLRGTLPHMLAHTKKTHQERRKKKSNLLAVCKNIQGMVDQTKFQPSWNYTYHVHTKVVLF
jgi:hypothetical protein